MAQFSLDQAVRLGLAWTGLAWTGLAWLSMAYLVLCFKLHHTFHYEGALQCFYKTNREVTIVMKYLR